MIMQDSRSISCATNHTDFTFLRNETFQTSAAKASRRRRRRRARFYRNYETTGSRRARFSTAFSWSWPPNARLEVYPQGDRRRKPLCLALSLLSIHFGFIRVCAYALFRVRADHFRIFPTLRLWTTFFHISLHVLRLRCMLPRPCSIDYGVRFAYKKFARTWRVERKYDRFWFCWHRRLLMVRFSGEILSKVIHDRSVV